MEIYILWAGLSFVFGMAGISIGVIAYDYIKYSQLRKNNNK